MGAYPTGNAARMALYDASTRSNEDEGPGNSGTMTTMATTTTRRTFFFMTNAALLGMGTAVLGLPTEPANAKYGTSSNMELPNYIEYLVEKNAQGSNAAVALYQGADPIVLLRRLQEANRRLQEIPTMATDKKWSQILGLLTGPLGTLSQTLNQIASSTVNPSDSKKQQLLQDASKRLKVDLIEIGQASAKKNADACITKAADASKDLVRFLEIAFEQ